MSADAADWCPANKAVPNNAALRRWNGRAIDSSFADSIPLIETRLMMPAIAMHQPIAASRRLPAFGPERFGRPARISSLPAVAMAPAILMIHERAYKQYEEKPVHTKRRIIL